jgi:hypothetical protein
MEQIGCILQSRAAALDDLTETFSEMQSGNFMGAQHSAQLSVNYKSLRCNTTLTKREIDVLTAEFRRLSRGPFSGLRAMQTFFSSF